MVQHSAFGEHSDLRLSDLLVVIPWLFLGYSYQRFNIYGTLLQLEYFVRPDLDWSNVGLERKAFLLAVEVRAVFRISSKDP